MLTTQLQSEDQCTFIQLTLLCSYVVLGCVHLHTFFIFLNFLVLFFAATKRDLAGFQLPPPQLFLFQTMPASTCTESFSLSRPLSCCLLQFSTFLLSFLVQFLFTFLAFLLSEYIILKSFCHHVFNFSIVEILPDHKF